MTIGGDHGVISTAHPMKHHQQSILFLIPFIGWHHKKPIIFIASLWVNINLSTRDLKVVVNGYIYWPLVDKACPE